ncbi:MAG: hypothetical protein ACJAXX_001287 [Roseivirga sp.]|jgi:hypothetical protein
MMVVLKKKIVNKIYSNVFMVIWLIGVFTLSSCAQGRVLDIVSNRDLKPNILFKKGNYITDIYSDQYLGKWVSGDYQIELIKNFKVDIGEGVFRDENEGRLIKLGKNGVPEFTLTFYLASLTKENAFGSFIDLNYYSLLMTINDLEQLEVVFEKRETLIITSVKEGQDLALEERVIFPEKLVFKRL